MSAEYVIAQHSKRLHIGVEQMNTTLRRPICGQLSPAGWFLNSVYGQYLGRNVTRICSACVREADRISGLAAGIQR
jgi:hypothetical protein